MDWGKVHCLYMHESDVFNLLIYNKIFQKHEDCSVAFGILETYLHPFPSGHVYAHLHLETGTSRGKDELNGGPLVPFCGYL